jgi:hypothetical protein
VLFAQHKEKGKHFPLSQSDCWMNNNTHPPTFRIQNEMDVVRMLMCRSLCAVGDETTREDISSENQTVFLISYFVFFFWGEGRFIETYPLAAHSAAHQYLYTRPFLLFCRKFERKITYWVCTLEICWQLRNFVLSPTSTTKE